MSYTSPLGAVAHSPPAPTPVLLVPAMVEQKPDQGERWMLSVSSGKWRYMTIDDLLCVVRQLSPEDARRVGEAAEREEGKR